ncbi:MAG: Procyclic acidic repetitive protein [Planctomycetota bacterium]|jgi:hypothetical protein
MSGKRGIRSRRKPLTAWQPVQAVETLESRRLLAAMLDGGPDATSSAETSWPNEGPAEPAAGVQFDQPQLDQPQHGEPELDQPQPGETQSDMEFTPQLVVCTFPMEPFWWVGGEEFSTDSLQPPELEYVTCEVPTDFPWAELPDAETETEAGPGPEPETEMELEPETEPVPETETELEPEPEPEFGFEFGLEPEPEPGVEFFVDDGADHPRILTEEWHYREIAMAGPEPELQAEWPVFEYAWPGDSEGWGATDFSMRPVGETELWETGFRVEEETVTEFDAGFDAALVTYEPPTEDGEAAAFQLRGELLSGEGDFPLFSTVFLRTFSAVAAIESDSRETVSDTGSFVPQQRRFSSVFERPMTELVRSAEQFADAGLVVARSESRLVQRGPVAASRPTPAAVSRRDTFGNPLRAPAGGSRQQSISEEVWGQDGWGVGVSRGERSQSGRVRASRSAKPAENAAVSGDQGAVARDTVNQDAPVPESSANAVPQH